MVLIKIYNLLFSEMWQNFFRYLYSMIVNHLVPSFFSALGVAILTIILMYAHYINRKKIYIKHIPFEEQKLMSNKNWEANYKEKMKQMAVLLGLNDYRELNVLKLSDLYRKKIITIDQFESFSTAYINYLDIKNRLLFNEIDLSHFKNYTFKIYLSDFLNSKYPDQHWQNKE